MVSVIDIVKQIKLTVDVIYMNKQNKNSLAILPALNFNTYPLHITYILISATIVSYCTSGHCFDE